MTFSTLHALRTMLLTCLGLLIGPTVTLAQEAEELDSDRIELSWGEPSPPANVEVNLWFDGARAPMFSRSGSGGKIQAWRVEGIREALGLIARKRRPERVTVRDEKGYWKATIDWTRLNWKQDELQIPIRWQRCGKLQLHGKVASTWGYRGPGAEPHEVFPTPRFQLLDKEGQRIPLHFDHKKTARWITPGQFTARISADRLAPQYLPVEVAAGSTASVNFGIRPFPETRTIHGWIHPGGLNHSPGLGGTIWSLDVNLQIQGAQWNAEVFTAGRCGTGRQPHDRVYWTAVCEKEIGNFEFRGVPKGPSDLDVTGMVDLKGADVLTRIVGDIESEQDLHVHMLDALEGPGWGIIRNDFDALTARELFNLESLGWWQVHVRPTPSDTAIGIHGCGQSVAIPHALVSKPKHWAIEIPHMQPVFGTAADFGPAIDGFQMAAISPMPGWGKSLRVLGRDTNPIEGARIYLDDILAGQCNSKGEAILLSSSPPKSIRIEAGDSVWAGAPVDWVGSPWATVQLP